MTEEPTEKLDDGFGNVWYKCSREQCALEIVRPGEVQCELCERNERDLEQSGG